MKVCIFECSQGLGRGEVYVDLANALVKRSSVKEVSIVAPQGVKYKERLDPAIKLIEYSETGSRRNLLTLCRLVHIFRKLKPDLVHCHFAKAATIFKTIQWFIGCAWCATKHNPRKGKIFTKVKHVTAVSQVVAESIPGRNDIRIIANGLDAAPNDFSKIRSTKIVKFLAVGRLEPIKGYDALIRALAATKKDNWTLSIAGDGAQRQELGRLVAELGLEEQVTFLGFRQDVKELMGNHHCTVISSKSEGFGMTLAEAFFYAPLLISTPVGKSPEVLPADFLMEESCMQERLNSVIEHFPELSSQFLSLALTVRPTLTLDKSVDEYITYYSELLDEL